MLMNVIKSYREKNQLTQIQLAEQLNIRASDVSSYENGLKVPAEKAVIWSQMIPELELFVLRPDLKIDPDGIASTR
jgi:transcriptional regulator with XRE-family HTH domain